MSRLIVVSSLILCAVFATPAHGLAEAACTRADLQSAVDSYLAAQRSGKPDVTPAGSIREIH